MHYAELGVVYFDSFEKKNTTPSLYWDTLLRFPEITYYLAYSRLEKK